MISDLKREAINYTTRGYAKRRAQLQYLRIPSEPHKVRFWKIEEAVGGGKYIILPGIYNTQQEAKKAFPAEGWCKAVEYQQGYGTDGPRRI